MTGSNVGALNGLRRAAGAAATLATSASAILAAGCGGATDTGGGLVAFTRASGTSPPGIHVVDRVGTVRSLTDGSGDGAPVWSPDGTRIAFVRAADAAPGAVRVVDLDGEETPVADGAAEFVAWSPDGRRLLLVEGGTVSVTDADGGGRREPVAESASAVKGAAWSPDGTRIVFTGGGGGLQTDLYVAEPGRAGTVRLTELPYEAGSPSAPTWSPDGEWIAFLLPGGVVVMEADGSEPREIVELPAGSDPTSLAWSPDGETLAYTVLSLQSPDDRSGVFLVSPDGGEPRQLTRADDVRVAWSPDGRELATQRFTDVQRSRIVAVDPDTGDEHPLTAPGALDAAPAWQPR